MAHMPDIGQEAWAAVTAARRFEHRVLQDLHLHKPHASQAPADEPVNVGTTTAKEQPMQLADDLRTIAGRIETIGEEGLATAEAVLANPETAQVLAVLRQLTGIGLPVGLIAEVAGGLSGLAKAYQPQQAAA